MLQPPQRLCGIYIFSARLQSEEECQLRHVLPSFRLHRGDSYRPVILEISYMKFLMTFFYC